MDQGLASICFGMKPNEQNIFVRQQTLSLVRFRTKDHQNPSQLFYLDFVGLENKSQKTNKRRLQEGKDSLQMRQMGHGIQRCDTFFFCF